WANAAAERIAAVPEGHDAVILGDRDMVDSDPDRSGSMAAPGQTRPADVRARLLGGSLPPGNVYRLHPEPDPGVPSAVPGADPGGVRLDCSGGVGIDLRRPRLARRNVDASTTDAGAASCS